MFGEASHGSWVRQPLPELGKEQRPKWLGEAGCGGWVSLLALGKEQVCLLKLYTPVTVTEFSSVCIGLEDVAVVGGLCGC